MPRPKRGPIELLCSIAVYLKPFITVTCRAQSAAY